MLNFLYILSLLFIAIGCSNIEANENSNEVREYPQVPYCVNDLASAKQLLGHKIYSQNELDSIEALYGILRRWELNPNFADENWGMEDDLEYFVAIKANLVFKIRRVNNPDFLDIGYLHFVEVTAIRTTPDFVKSFLSQNELHCANDPLQLFDGESIIAK